MEKVSRLTQDHRENLVAYLDGELDETSSQEIDRLLSRSEVARHEVEVLSRTWEMLDLLPLPQASSTFTEKTMATIRLEETPLNLTAQKWFTYLRRGTVGALWLVILAASGLLGFYSTWKWYPNPNRDLLEELPLIEQFHNYTEVESPEFLEALRTSGVFEGGDDAASQP